METKLTEVQSLTLISEMIEQARNNFQKGAGTAFIFNGCAVACTALLNVALIFLLPDPYQSFWIWLLMIPSSFIDSLINKKVYKQALVRTHIDTIIGSAWKGFAYSIVIFLILIFGYGASMKEPRIFLLITPVIMTMSGIAQFVTAKACRYKPVLIGAYIMWAGALLCLVSCVSFQAWSGITHFIILAVCMILGFVVPGYKMNQLAKNHV